MGTTILIVDDSQTMRKIIMRTITMAGVSVGEMVGAEDGEKALEILRNKAVDIVITDINMPIMDGIAMIERMDDDEVLRKVPVVVISTEGSEAKIERLAGKNVRAYIRKPFSPELIRDTLQTVLGVSYASK
jgi:two-component system, chemotaxis family, chemotaxis protein CheY